MSMSDDTLFSPSALNDEYGVLHFHRGEKSPGDRRPLKEAFDGIVDVTQSVFFHTGYAFRSTDENCGRLAAYLCPSFEGNGVELHEYSHRNRHPSRCIDRIVEPGGRIAIPDISKIYHTMNGLLDCISRSEMTRDFVVFSFPLEQILLEQRTHRLKFEWFTELVNTKEANGGIMVDEGTKAYSVLFEQLLANREVNWFEMNRVDGGIEWKTLNAGEGFWNTKFKYVERDRHEIALNVSNLCVRNNYMALFVWKFSDEQTRVYLNWKGFRINLNSTSDVYAVVKKIFQRNLELAGRDDFVTDDVDVGAFRDIATQKEKIMEKKEYVETWFKPRPEPKPVVE